MLGLKSALALALLGFAASACDTTQLAAASTVDIIGKAFPAIERYQDADLAEQAIPASIATMDGLLELRPEDTHLRLLVAQSYGLFGFGFLEDHMEAALANDDDKLSEHFQKRASLAYQRGRKLALGSMTLWQGDDGGAEGHLKKGLAAWTEYLKKFDDAEKYVPTMFWAAYCWGRYIGINRDDVNALADLPYVNALSDRVFALDATYYGYAPHALRAGLIGTAPAQLGGKPEQAKQEFEAAIAGSHGKNLMYPVLEAQIVAVALQDRALYKKLLTGVLAAPDDIDPDESLVTALAKRRATRYLDQIDELFAPEEPPPAASDSAAGAAPAAPAPAAPAH